MNISKYNTKYGTILLPKNEKYIGNSFNNGKYWDEETLILLKKYIDPTKNIIEIGGHCGTSSIVYASYLNNNSQVYVYEPQKNMYDLLKINIYLNELTNKIIPYNLGVFCYNGEGTMNSTDLDGGGGNIEKRYTTENELDCNFGGVCLGKDGEQIKLITMEDMQHTNIGFIHCDAQGAESYIFSKGINLINQYKPVILFENNKGENNYLYQEVYNSYIEYKKKEFLI